MKLYTLGFTQKNAPRFFELLQQNNVRRVIDVRLNNRSQLAGFTRCDDLRFFLAEIAGIEYLHAEQLAPSQSILRGYKQGLIDWPLYCQQYNQLLDDRGVADYWRPDELDQNCLLCSEHLPEYCHRRLVAEYLQRHWQTAIEIEHLQ